MDNNSSNYKKLSKQQRDMLFDRLTGDTISHVQSTSIQESVQHEREYNDILIPDLINATEYNNQGAQIELSIPQGLWSKAVGFSEESKYTLMELMLTCYVITLFKYTVHESFGLGLPVSGQKIAGIKCKRFKQESCHGYLAYIHNELRAAFKLKCVPLFQSFFSFDATQAIKRTNYIPEFQAHGITEKCAMFDLHCNVVERDAMGLLYFVYKPTLFLEETMLQLGMHFLTVLTEFLNDPLQLVSDVNLLSETELSTLLLRGNIRNFSKEEVEHPLVLFAKQCLSHTNNAKIYSKGEAFSHQELFTSSIAYASVLKSMGVKHGDCVAIANDLDAACLCTILALWQCGASYVSIDPTTPRRRVETQLAQVEPAFIICNNQGLFDDYSFSGKIINGLDNAKLKEKADEIDDQQVFEMFTEELHSFSNENLSMMAYQCFTSGSSGIPKAVVISHQALGNFLQSMFDIIKPTQNDRFCAVTNLSFDIHVLELFLPLIAGADLMLPTDAIKSNPARMVTFVQEHQISAMQATPSYWKLLFESDFLPSVDHFVALCGGEALSKSLAQKFLQKHCVLWNMYGPTETTVWSTCCRITNLDRPIAIGTPIANTCIAVLDEQLSFVPSGALGELYIGGLGLALGYAGDEQLTDQRFCDISFAGQSYRFYKTGDMVRFNHWGDLEFHGRVDSQVKFNGHRIEPDEINVAILQHEAVKHVVTENIIDADNQYLVSFVEYWDFKEGQDIAIREMLMHVLPQAIMPNHIIPVDTVPLNENKKIDKRALLALWNEYKKNIFNNTTIS